MKDRSRNDVYMRVRSTPEHENTVLLTLVKVTHRHCEVSFL